MLRIPGYRILRALGSGSSGTVYLAVQEALGRQVALKVLAPGLFGVEETRARFLREARAQARLSHPHLLALYDAGFEQGRPYLAMELVESGSLRDRLAGGPLPLGDAVRISREIAEGLAAAHAAGIVHRDLKPENVLLTDTGQAKIADFGLAKPIGENSTFQSTAGVILGTPGYLAPEVVEGCAPSPAADLYALGAMLHELLSGRRPFPDGDLSELFRSQRDGTPEPLPPAVPAGLGQLRDRLLSPDPAARPASAAAIAEALADIRLEPSVESHRTSTRTQVIRPSRTVRAPATRKLETELPRARWPAWLFAATAAAAGFFFAGPSPGPPPPAPPARVAAPPAFAETYVGADRALVYLDRAAPAGTKLEIASKANVSPIVVDVREGDTQVRIPGLKPGVTYEAACSAGGVRTSTHFATLGGTTSGGVRIEPDADYGDISIATRGALVAVASTLTEPGSIYRGRFQASLDGGQTWSASLEPPGHGDVDIVRAGIGDSGWFVAAVHPQRAAPGVERRGFVLRRALTGAGWNALELEPPSIHLCPELGPAPEGALDLFYADDGNRLLGIRPEDPVRPLEIFAKLPPRTLAMRALRTRTRVVLLAQPTQLPQPRRTLFCRIDSDWKQFSHPELPIGDFELAAVGETIVAAYEADSKVFVRTLRPGERDFTEPVAPLEQAWPGDKGAELPDLRGCSVTAAGGRFFLAAVALPLNVAVRLAAADSILIFSSDDGTRWVRHARIPLRQTGMPRCLRIGAVGESLLTILSSRSDGLFAFRTPIH